MEWSTACVDWRDLIIARRSLIPSPLYADEGDQALRVFKSLYVVDAPAVIDAVTGDARPPTFGETCEPWVFDFVRAIFGAYDRDNGRQLIREFFLLISKKNGKSTIAAGIMVTALIRNWRYNNELLILAPTIEVADNAFAPAKAMIDADEQLAILMHIQEHTRTIKHRNTGAKLKVVAADSDTVSGKKAGYVFIDELWIFGKRPKADSMLREATGGLVARPEGFVIWASTQSDEPPAGVFRAKLDYFRGVRDGCIDDPRSLPVIYEYPEDMIASKAYLDADTFYIPNPNLGRSVDRQWLSDELAKVANATGTESQVFLSKHLNIEIGLRLTNSRWRGTDYWEGASDPSLTFRTILERSEVVTVGIDGGGLDDLFGLAIIGREKETRQWMSWAKVWAHDDVLTRRKEIAPALLDFAADGDLVVVEETMQDVIEVANIVAEIRDLGLLPEKHGVGVDASGIAPLVDELARRDIGEPLVTSIRQGFGLMPAIHGLERKLKDKTLTHHESAMMTWCVGNAAVSVRSNAVMITKETAGRAKIDPVIALMNAAILMSYDPAPAVAPTPEIFFL